MLQLRNVSKVYSSGHNKVVALKDINIDFPEKGMVFVVGKSGSGKSTLLNLLGGLDKMTTGEVIIDGFSTNKFTGSDFNSFRNFFIGFIFQDFNLIDEINVYDNIATVLKIQSKDHDTNTIDDALKMVGLEGLGYRKPSELSGGQRQRIAIARALVKNPRIILADEPTGALDSKTGHDLIASLKNLAEEKLVIIVSHDLELAVEYGDQIIELKDGEIVNTLELRDNERKIIELSENVLKVPANLYINNPDILNALLVDDKINYLCINTQIDRVSLAYNETFDYLYNNKSAAERFSPVKKDLEAITYKKTKFEKAKIRANDLLKMAISSIKRKKVRFSFALIFISISMVFLSTALVVSQVTSDSITALTIKSKDLPFAAFAIQNNYFYGNQAIKKETFDFLTENKLDYAKNFAKKIYYKEAQLSSFRFGFNGIAEVDDLAKFDIKMREGKSTLDGSKETEAIITDYYANNFLETGYLGYDADGNFTALYPKNYKEMINTVFLANIDNVQDPNFLSFKIVGIIDSGYEEHIKKHDSSDSYAYGNYFDKLFVPNGTKDKLIDSGILNVSGIMYCNDKYYNSYFASLKLLLNSDARTGKTVLYGNLPAKLGDFELAISKKTVAELLRKNIENLTNQDYEDIMNTVYKVIDWHSEDSYSSQNVEIVAIFDSMDSESLVSDFLKDTINASANAYKQALVKTSNNENQIIEIVRLLKNKNLFFSEGYYNYYDSLDYQLESMRSGFLIISSVFGVLGFLVTINFIAGSIKSRKKEIGVLRASGARSTDVFNIFFAEILFMSLIIWLFAGFITNFVVNLVNGTLVYSVGIQFMNYSLFSFILTGLLTFLFLMISAAIPLMNIVTQKPIDAIKRV